MSLKFTCPTCGVELATQFLEPGEIARCNNCGADVIVADNAEHVDWESSFPCKDKTPINNEQDRILKRNFPTFWQAVLLLISVGVVTILIYIPVGFIEAISDSNFSDNILIDSLLEIIVAGIVIYIGFRRTGRSLGEVFPVKRFDFFLVLPMICTLIGIQILLSDFDNLLSTIIPPPPQWFIELFMDLLADPFNAVISFIIVAPLIEETICRGLILHGFLRNYSQKKAIITSALLFALMHLNPWQFTGAFIYGILFARLYILTRSLLPCYIGHAVANGIPLIILYCVNTEIPGYTTPPTGETLFQPWWFDLIGLALAGLGIWWLMIIFRKDSDKRSEDSNFSLLQNDPY